MGALEVVASFTAFRVLSRIVPDVILRSVLDLLLVHLNLAVAMGAPDIT